MKWIKLDADFMSNPKINGLSISTRYLYIAGLLHSAQHLTDGVVAAKMMPLLHFQTGTTPEACEELTSMGLWENHLDGYQILNYLKHQTSKETVAKARTKDATRKAQTRRKKAADKGKASEVRPTNVQPLEVEVEVELELEVELEKNASPISAKSTGLTIPDDEVIVGFEDFWNAYAKKQGKKTARAQWDRHVVGTGVDRQMVIGAASAYAQATEQKYRKDPERWLRDHRWEDEPISMPLSPGELVMSYFEDDSETPLGELS